MEYRKSALTNHVNQANHTVDWKKTTVIDREQDHPTRWIKEAVRDVNFPEKNFSLRELFFPGSRRDLECQIMPA